MAGELLSGKTDAWHSLCTTAYALHGPRPHIACEMEHGIKVTMLQIWEILRCAPTVRLCCFPTRQQVSAARQAKY